MDPTKYRPFLDKLSDEKNLFINFNPKKDKEIENDKPKIVIYFDALRETFYRKYDEQNYLKLSKNPRFLQSIKSQIILNVITKEDNVNFEIIIDLLGITENIEEIVSILKLHHNIYQILGFIETNYTHIKSIYSRSKKKLDIFSLLDIIETENF